MLVGAFTTPHGFDQAALSTGHRLGAAGRVRRGGERGWGREERGEDSLGIAMCRDDSFCAIWIWGDLDLGRETRGYVTAVVI